jgi:hypothetical protein
MEEVPRKYNPEAMERLAKPKKIPVKIEEPLPPTKKCDGKVFNRLYDDAKKLEENKIKIEAAKLYILEERRIKEMNIMTRKPDNKKDSKTILPKIWMKDSMTMTSRGELYNIKKGIGERGIQYDSKKEVFISLTNCEYNKVMDIVKSNKNPEDILDLKLDNVVNQNKNQRFLLNKSFRFPNKIELLNLLKEKDKLF